MSSPGMSHQGTNPDVVQGCQARTLERSARPPGPGPLWPFVTAPSGKQASSQAPTRLRSGRRPGASAAGGVTSASPRGKRACRQPALGRLDLVPSSNEHPVPVERMFCRCKQEQADHRCAARERWDLLVLAGEPGPVPTMLLSVTDELVVRRADPALRHHIRGYWPDTSGKSCKSTGRRSCVVRGDTRRLL